jgi:hypothetical protein
MNTNKPSTIEAAILLSQMETIEIEKIGAVTGVKLSLDRARSHKHFHVFRGCNDAAGAIAEVECRTARVNGASKGALIYLALNEKFAPTGAEVVSRLGKPRSVQAPSAQAGAGGSTIYVYPISGGELRFAVKAGAPDAVFSIAIDRTALVPHPRVASRLAKWGNVDLTPFTA